jgi:hypothetical protein
MAHLPRDGKGRKKDAGGRVACNGHYDAAKGPPADQLLVTRSGSSLLKLARTTSQLGSPYVSGRSRHWVKSKNPAAPSVKREAEEDWGRGKWR